MTNTWLGADSKRLLAAYDRHNNGVRGMLRQRLLTRALAQHLPRVPQQIVDIGGGEGYQAVNLARLGHHVVLLDPDTNMLSAAQRRLADESQEVRDRVELVVGLGEDATELLGEARFDVVCCHGILMYVDHPLPLLKSAVRLTRPRGVVSVLALNHQALAMRPGLEGRWSDALDAMRTGTDTGGHNLKNRPDSRPTIERILARLGAPTAAWYGIRVFADHLGDIPPGPRFEDLVELEWVAGSLDPYRDVARLFHIVARRESAPTTS